jgi:hypothetical protein
MPKAATHVRVVRQWCQSLGVLSAISITRHEAEMKLSAFVPLLVKRFPDACFTTASLEYVAARAVKGFPTYGELAQWLADWWRETRPPLPALPPPPPIRQRDEPTPEEIAYVERIVAACVADLRSSAQPLADRRPPGARHLSPAMLDRINPLPGGRKRRDEPGPLPAGAEHADRAMDHGGGATVPPVV